MKCASNHGGITDNKILPCPLGLTWMLKFDSCLAVNVQRFLQRFIDPMAKEENVGLDLNEPLYMQRLEEVHFSSIL